MGNVLHRASLLFHDGPVGRVTMLLDVRTPNNQYEDHQTETGHNGKHHEQGHASRTIDRFGLQRDVNIDITSEQTGRRTCRDSEWTRQDEYLTWNSAQKMPELRLMVVSSEFFAR